jgi:hypothetical protein
VSNPPCEVAEALLEGYLSVVEAYRVAVDTLVTGLHGGKGPEELRELKVQVDIARSLPAKVDVSH